MHVFGPDRFRRKVNEFAVAGERQVQLGEAPSDLRHVTQIGDLLLAFGGMFTCAEQALFVDEAIEIGRGHCPGVALVFDKGMNGRNGISLIALDQLGAAEQRRRIGKTRDFGQKAADLDLGIDAGFELAMELDHILVVDQCRAVGLFSFDDANVLRLLDWPVRKLGCWAEFQTHAIFFDGQAVAEIAQQQRGKDRVGRNVEQRSFPRTLTHGCERVRIIAFAIETHPLDPHRQYVTHRCIALCRLEKGQPGPVVANIAERDSRGQGGMDRLRRTLRVPAGPRQMSGQDIAFEYAAGTGQRHPGRAERHDEGLEFGNDRWGDVLRLVALLKLEPVEAVWRQRDHVGQFADRRKAGAPEHFQGDPVFPC